MRLMPCWELLRCGDCPAFPVPGGNVVVDRGDQVRAMLGWSLLSLECHITIRNGNHCLCQGNILWRRTGQLLQMPRRYILKQYSNKRRLRGLPTRELLPSGLKRTAEMPSWDEAGHHQRFATAGLLQLRVGDIRQHGG